ncbi:unnamed protein product [Caenorhabditis sp. 36 PRJEB53466]|nr:unnamed protein product [Caenorhabditis sp. 36 PRJEB53466]
MTADIVEIPAGKQAWSQLILDTCNFLAEMPQTKLSEQLLASCNREWTEGEKAELIEAFGGKKRPQLTKSGVKSVLMAFEGDRTQADIIFLCRLLDLIFSHFTAENDRKREKLVVKCDAVATLCRITRKRIILTVDMSEEPGIDPFLDHLLYKLLLSIGNKDPRISLKVRMGGLIGPMCKLFIRKDPLPDAFIPFFVKISRSPRNAQSIGRQEGFLSNLMKKIKILDGSDQTAQILLLDKHLQILFFCIKNSAGRVRNQLLRESICKYLLEVLRRHLGSSSNSRPTRLLSSLFGTLDKSVSAAHTEVVIGTIAILRLLSNFKKAREELKNLQVLEICSRELKEFWSDEWKTGPKAKIVDSLSALCLRCMSPIPYPLETRRFPVDFPLPQATPTGNGRTRNSNSLNISFDNGRSSDEDGMDEEDEAFVRDDDDKDAMIGGASDDDDAKEDEDDEGGALPKTTRLTAQQLTKYAPFFVENEQGTLQPTFSMMYQTEQDTWRATCEKTRHVMPIHHHLPLEMFSTPTRARERTAKTTNNMKKMIIEEMDKPERSATNQTIYDLDTAAFDGLPAPELPFPTSGLKLDTAKDLQFDSRFESGNLRMVVQVAPTHYELFLSPDVNQLRDHYQWFFFQVSNMRKSVKYTFEIVNCLKSTSLYSQGMQPVMYSMMDGANGWRRTGENVCYFRNLYMNEHEEKRNTDEKQKKKHYYSVRFNVTFQHTGDICYIAYHYPYTYSFLNSSIGLLRKRKPEGVYCREDVIGHTLAGNPIKMLTITTPATAAEIVARDVIVLSARVHPGETNASWIMHGILENLLCRQSAEMHRLRETFVFKIIPMINPDGVINGSHRCSLAGIDLNRAWDRPNEQLHPEIYAAKAVIQYLCEVVNKKPFAYVDLHGHSKKWDYFVYGNNAADSWRADDVAEVAVAQLEEDAHLALPKALEQTCGGRFNASECRFNIARSKESSARVNVWRQFGVATSYTLESTFCGFHKGQNNGYQINTSDLKEIGRDLLLSFIEMSKN